MLELTYEIKFLSPWHCGSGMSGGDDADYVPLVDSEGIPFVPGKTLKGLFREAAEILCNEEFVKKIFGQASGKDTESSGAGTVTWSNAVLPDAIRQKILEENLTQELLKARYFIRIDSSGQTADGSLRRGEYAIPMTLQGHVGNVQQEDVDNLKKCFGFVKEFGLQRSRGFGRCNIRLLESKPQESTQLQIKGEAGTYYFKCRFLSPIILNASGATEGPLDTLEYIPGSNFLGIAAREYSKYQDDAFLVFHSGKVRFSCGYPLEDGTKESFPCPATWFIPKGMSFTAERETSPIFSMPEQITEDIQKEQQPKQIRGGFFIPGKAPHALSMRVGKRFSLKSAYDSEKRRAQDSQMFGYTALNEGSDWIFSIKTATGISEDCVQRLVKSMIGKKQLGRSKNAQYGSVEITYLKDFVPEKIKECSPADQLYLLYAKSPLAFLDENGGKTLIPSVRNLGFQENAVIDMQHTQIRSYQYSPWNGTRKSRDGERLILLPGSVIAVRAATPPNAEALGKGVGLYLSEGFGEILCNPEFLLIRKLSAAPKTKTLKPNAKDIAIGRDPLLLHLYAMRQQKNVLRTIYKHVLAFVRTAPPNRITASQWGAVRAIVLSSKDADELSVKLFQKEDEAKMNDVDYIDIIKNNKKSHANHPGFLLHGKMAKFWKESGMAIKLQEAIRKFQESTEGKQSNNVMIFVELLTSEMAKTTKK